MRFWIPRSRIGSAYYHASRILSGRRPDFFDYWWLAAPRRHIVNAHRHVVARIQCSPAVAKRIVEIVAERNAQQDDATHKKQWHDGLGFLAALLVVIAIIALSGCDQGAKKKPPELSVGQWLYACSPFESLDGKRMLVFRPSDHSVTSSEAIGDEAEVGALAAKNPQRTKGTWEADEATKRVVVNIGDSQFGYLLIVPFGEGQCILGAGNIRAVDLRRSLFGEPDFSDER